MRVNVDLKCLGVKKDLHGLFVWICSICLFVAVTWQLFGSQEATTKKLVTTSLLSQHAVICTYVAMDVDLQHITQNGVVVFISLSFQGNTLRVMLVSRDHGFNPLTQRHLHLLPQLWELLLHRHCHFCLHGKTMKWIMIKASRNMSIHNDGTTSRKSK